ncbi:MAG: hypothetical protein K9N46_11355 [Candidatus Marinimicrobia bacterium]|nr:hypothetical protein [Candidatus Neomarinimicrobiota bacterium]MCF7827620.1 hypothetical protein [Candidatus Neomarinimicrobiota bacterium]MCF7881325.1 hypothetical protein [Candidatus Neomarinimicrobiota bacterium]
MFQKDYLMRQIMEFSKGLARILGRQKSGEVVETGQELDEIYQSSLGLGRDTVLQMSDQQLLILFGGEEAIESDKCIMLAELFYTELQLLHTAKDDPLRNELRLRALRYYLLAVHGTDMWDDTEFRQHFEEVRDSLSLSNIPISLLEYLVTYYERVGDQANKAQVMEEISRRT